MDNNMKKRWISLYVENQVGVLSKISGLFSGKCYNLDSLTVGTTEDPTVSRMTIATVSDDETFEQIKKQLNRMIEVIKVIDFTDVFVRMKEILYVKVLKCTPEDKVEIFQIAETFKAKVIDYGKERNGNDAYDSEISSLCTSLCSCYNDRLRMGIVAYDETGKRSC